MPPVATLHHVPLSMLTGEGAQHRRRRYLPRVVYDRWKVSKVPAVCRGDPAYGTGLNGRVWGGWRFLDFGPKQKSFVGDITDRFCRGCASREAKKDRIGALFWLAAGARVLSLSGV